jgi:hypothetical protein
MPANDKRSPKHYVSEYQHWDLVINTGMGYLNGNATKYIARWRLKNGLEDLQKALHYIDKLIEQVPAETPFIVRANKAKIFNEVERFVVVNMLFERERDVIQDLAGWEARSDILNARDRVLELIESLGPKPVPLEDSNKHAIQDPTGW